MINLKKIASVLASVAMVGSTMGFAAAAAYPSPFVTNGAGDVGIVYGSNDDFTAATNIGTNLGKSITTGVSAPTGESVLFEKSSTKFQIGRGVLDIVATAIDDDNPGNGLPTLLAEGTYVDDDNDEFDFTQKIEMGNASLTMWESSDYIENEPTLGFKLADNDNVLNYTLEFTEEPLWGDLATTDLNIMGKKYFILSITNGTTLNLLDAAQSTTLAEGESATLTVDGITYTITLDFVGSSTARFTINGDQTNALSAGETQKIAGAYIGVKAIDSQDYSGGVKNVEFSLGAGKLELVHNTDIKINDVSISDLKAIITNGASSTSPYTTLRKLVINWDAEDDLFVTESSEVTMPGFESVKLSYTGMNYPAEETITVAKYNEAVIMLDDFPLKTSSEDINLIWANASDYIANLTGKSTTSLLLTSNNTAMLWNDTIHDYFVASYNNGNDAESYLMRFTNFATKSTSAGSNQTTVQYKKDGAWVDIKDATARDSVTVGNIELTIDQIEKNLKWVNFTGGSNIAFNTIYSKEGMKMWLPWANVTGLNANDPYGSADITDFGSDKSLGAPGYIGIWNGKGSRTMNLTFEEEDLNEVPAGGMDINLTLGFNSASTPEVSVTGITKQGPTGISSTEIQETDVYRDFIESALGTEILWSKPTSGQYSVKLVYHGAESYGNLYLTAPTSAAGGATGIVPVMDTKVADVQAKNLIVVGGSCVNTVAAKLLGSDVPLCDADWTAKTGVGAGEWLIATYGNPYTTGKIAVLVAGFEKADTTSAANYLTANSPDVATVATKIEGPK